MAFVAHFVCGNRYSIAPLISRRAGLSVVHSPRHARANISRVAWTATAVQSPISIDMADDTRLMFRFSLEAATQLGEQINELIGSFKAIAESAKEGKRSLQKSLDFCHEENSLIVNIECNPNVFPNAFNAKVYVTVDDGIVKVSSQAMLTRLIDNVKAYKITMSA
jgi:hypothetical protein